jgi:IclR family mhp operon transcriptional activator
LVEIGADILREATKEVRWPLALGTLDGAEVVVRYSTMPFSNFTVGSTNVGRRHSLIETAMGTADRDHLLRLMRQQGHSSSNDAKFEHEIAKVVDRVRMLGYGLRQGKLADDSSSIAVPIMSRGRVAGVVSMTMFKRSLDESAFWRFPPPQSFTKSPGVALRAYEPFGRRYS